MAGKPSKRTAENRDKFLRHLRSTFSVYHAAKLAKLGRTTAYEWRRDDKEFAAAWDAALEDSADRVERSLFERAVKGVEEPVFYQGVECGTVTRYSDTAAIFLLKGARPEKYRDRQEHSGPGGGPIAVAATTAEVKLTDAQRAHATASLLASLGIPGGEGAAAPVDAEDE